LGTQNKRKFVIGAVHWEIDQSHGKKEKVVFVFISLVNLIWSDARSDVRMLAHARIESRSICDSLSHIAGLVSHRR
jgi:hypothetical protein